MKIPALFLTTLLLASLTAASVVQASCQASEPEIGDIIGPDGNRVCADLKREFPSANVRIDDQTIHSPTDVVITVQIDRRPFSLEYRLEDAHWSRMPALSLAGE